MAGMAVMRRPDVFHVAVSGAPVCDFAEYDTHYTERYLGLPETHGEAYRKSSLHTYARGLKRPMLFIHGTADDNCYFAGTLRMSDALFRAGIEHEFLPLSGETHMVLDPIVQIRMYERIARFFKRHLG